MPSDVKSSALDAARERIGHRLQESIDRLRTDLARVEYWLEALDGFSKSVPSYDPNAASLNRYLLPKERDRDRDDHDRDNRNRDNRDRDNRDRDNRDRDNRQIRGDRDTGR